jgi:hypothetical protein
MCDNCDSSKSTNTPVNTPIGSVTWLHLMIAVMANAKLAGNFDYSWWVVFSPWLVAFWIGLLFIGLEQIKKALTGNDNE